MIGLFDALFGKPGISTFVILMYKTVLMPKKFPIGIQDFRGIISDGYKYIDKTQYVHLMCTSGKYFFLSRPRRFGKSLTLSLIQELYFGSKELFKGLWIEDKWDWSKKHPVIRLTLTGIGVDQSGLAVALEYALQRNFAEHHIKPITGSPSSQLDYLILQLSKINKVVVLVDEYDAPIVQYLGKNLEKAYENRDILRDFYAVLKNNDHLIELAFITGVSKFSKVGIFSGLNNLIDLTINAEFAAMMGYTQQELEDNFADELPLVATKLKLSTSELLSSIRLWYNGYRFHEEAETVYNPVSTNMFFFEKNFKNFWFATGTPSFLVDLLKQEGIYDLHFPPSNLAGFESFDLDRLKPMAILYQTGYLTMKEKDEDGLILLDYPNKEVKDSMLEILIETYVGIDAEFSTALIVRLRKAFENNDLDTVMRILQGIFKDLPYFLHEKYPEKFFHAAIHLLFSYLGIRIQSEVCISDGRVDSLVETDTHVYILEYKLDESAAVALAQIREKKYYEAYWHKGKMVVGVGVNFSSGGRNIDAWEMEVMG